MPLTAPHRTKPARCARHSSPVGAGTRPALRGLFSGHTHTAAVSRFGLAQYPLLYRASCSADSEARRVPSPTNVIAWRSSMGLKNLMFPVYCDSTRFF